MSNIFVCNSNLPIDVFRSWIVIFTPAEIAIRILFVIDTDILTASESKLKEILTRQDRRIGTCPPG